MMNTLSCFTRRNLQQIRRLHRCLVNSTPAKAAAQPATAPDVPPPPSPPPSSVSEEISQTETLAGPQVSVRIQAIADEIVSLNLIEVAQLSEILKKRLNLPDTPVMSFAAAGAVPAAAAEEEEAPAAQQTVQTSFSVKVTGFDAAKKIDIIKAVKSIIPNCNLVQAKKFVESLPGKIKSDIPKDEADQLKTLIEAAGGQVTIE